MVLLRIKMKSEVFSAVLRPFSLVQKRGEGIKWHIDFLPLSVPDFVDNPFFISQKIPNSLKKIIGRNHRFFVRYFLLFLADTTTIRLFLMSFPDLSKLSDYPESINQLTVAPTFTRLAVVPVADLVVQVSRRAVQDALRVLLERFPRMRWHVIWSHLPRLRHLMALLLRHAPPVLVL